METRDPQDLEGLDLPVLQIPDPGSKKPPAFSHSPEALGLQTHILEAQDLQTEDLVVKVPRIQDQDMEAAAEVIHVALIFLLKMHISIFVKNAHLFCY